MEKYKIIAKVEGDRFVKYRSDDLLSFTKFLDRSYPNWKWFNVYNSGGQQVANFTINNRPISKQLI